VKPLAGKLIAFPTPNRPGFWAYRILDDDTALETELTREEWQMLHESEAATKKRIEAALCNCDLPMARKEIQEFHTILNQQAQADGGVFCFKNEYVAALKDFCIEPDSTNARALLNIAPQLIEYFESCPPGGNLYAANTRRRT